MATNCSAMRPKATSATQKRWSQHIVASTYDDVCVLLKYQTRHHSQDDLLMATKISHIPSKTYSTLTHHCYSKTTSCNSDNNNNINNFNSGNLVAAAASSNGGRHSSTKTLNNNRNQIFSLQTVNDTSGLTENSNNGNQLADFTCNHRNEKTPQQQQQEQQQYETGSDYRSRRRLTRPISCFEPGDHVCSFFISFFIFFFYFRSIFFI